MFESMADKGGKDSTLEKNKAMYSLTFTYDFEYENDIVFFCHSFPYTTTESYEFLDKMEQKYSHTDYYRRDMLCSTLGDRPCYMLTITEGIDSYMNPKEERKYFSCFKDEIIPSQSPEDDISEITKNGYKAGQEKVKDIGHDSNPQAFK